MVERSAPGGRARNVLLITSDTTRRDQLSVYGGPVATPHLEALGKEGVLFHQAFSVAFGTTPSHTSLFTSSHPSAHGVYDNRSIVGSEQVTLAEVLRDAGYATAAFVSARPVARAVGLAQGFDVYDDVLVRDESSGLGPLARGQRRADVTIDRFLDWFGEGPPEPFFVWLHVFDAHQPYSPPIGSDPLPPGHSPHELERFFRDGKGDPRSFRFTWLDEEPDLQSLLEVEPDPLSRRYDAGRSRPVLLLQPAGLKIDRRAGRRDDPPGHRRAGDRDHHRRARDEESHDDRQDDADPQRARDAAAEGEPQGAEA